MVLTMQKNLEFSFKDCFKFIIRNKYSFYGLNDSNINHVNKTKTKILLLTHANEKDIFLHSRIKWEKEAM